MTKTALVTGITGQVRMFPNMMSPEIRKVMDSYREPALAFKLAGAGGGGYLVMVAEHPVPGAMKLKIRRNGM